MDELLKNQVAETIHYRWMDEQKAAGKHHPDHHNGGKTCANCNKKLVDWTGLHHTQKGIIFASIRRTEEALLTLNYLVVPKAKLEERRDNMTFSKLPQLKELIHNFVMKVKHPPRMAATFPTEELARQILMRWKIPNESE
jgi:hypothetical protein